jgi:hypothetical protein
MRQVPASVPSDSSELMIFRDVQASWQIYQRGAGKNVDDVRQAARAARTSSTVAGLVM